METRRDSGSRLRNKDLGASLLPQLLNRVILSKDTRTPLSRWEPRLSTLVLAVRLRLSISNLLLAAHIRSRVLKRRLTALRLRVTLRLFRGLVTRNSNSRRSAATLSRG